MDISVHVVYKNWRFIEGGGDNIGKSNTLKIEVGLRQNALLGETAPPTSQFVRFFSLNLKIMLTASHNCSVAQYIWFG